MNKENGAQTHKKPFRKQIEDITFSEIAQLELADTLQFCVCVKYIK